MTCAEGYLIAIKIFSADAPVLSLGHPYQNQLPIFQSPFPYPVHFEDSDLLVQGAIGRVVR